MFEIHEEHLQALVKRAETPVLGLLGTLLPPDARDAIRRDLAVMPSAKVYSQRLEKYPALFLAVPLRVCYDPADCYRMGSSLGLEPFFV